LTLYGGAKETPPARQCSCRETKSPAMAGLSFV
jgi:hypothetical protein